MFAVSIGRELGIDVERIKPAAIWPMAERVFSVQEVAALRALPAAHQLDAFYRGWTRKEAYAKALGTGFALPPRDVDVSLDIGEAHAFRQVRSYSGEAESWWFRDLPAPPGYLAALAVEGGDCFVRAGWWRPADPSV
jgi:4'-phosphopantetheinyl transferase